MPGPARRVGGYELVRRLGRGGMGVVFLAREVQTGRTVALKELALGFADDAAVIRRFAREARSIASLQHPNIVAAYEFIWHEDAPFIVMEYVPGGSLRPQIGRLDHDQAATVLDGVLAGLGHAHERGIVHRDLKPENLLFAGDGTVKIVDFGIAKAVGDTTLALTADSGLLGSPTYLAPEQAAGGPVGPWTDLYSTGVIAYELFVGTPPFHGSAIPELLLRHVNEPVPPPRESRPDLPPPLEQWILRLLEKDGRNRPHDAVAVAAELDAVMSAWKGPSWRRAPVVGDARERTRLPTMDSARRRTARRLPALRWSWRGLAAVALVVGAAVALPKVSGRLERLELSTLDLRFAVRGTQRPASDIVIVGYDKASADEFSNFGDASWPRPRRLHAQLIDALRRDGADVIVYPDAFAETGADEKRDATVIVDAIKRASDAGTQVVLGDVLWENIPAGGMLSFGDSSALLRSGGVEAGVSSQPDVDGVYRRIDWSPNGDANTLAITAATVAARRAAGQPPSRPRGTIWIDFAGSDGTIPIVSWARVATGRIAAGTFRGKVVVVGSPAFEEHYLTPTSDEMSGVELAANAIATAHVGFPLRDAPRALGVLLGLALALLPLAARRWRGRVTTVVVSLGAVAAYATVACIAFTRGAVLPVVYPLAALVLMTLAALILRAKGDPRLGG